MKITLTLTLFLFIPFILLSHHVLASPLAPRGSEEALSNIQYLTTFWKSYTTTLLNISCTYHIPPPKQHQPQYNTSLLPLDAQYAVIAVVSNYNMNFRYENYVIDRISQGPVLNKETSKELVKAIKELLGALRPLFTAFEVFINIIGKENLGYALGPSYQGQVGLLLDAIAGVVSECGTEKVERLARKHDKIVADLWDELGV